MARRCSAMRQSSIELINHPDILAVTVISDTLFDLDSNQGY